MRSTADAGRCVSSGMRVLTAGDVYDQRRDDGTAVVVRTDR